MKIEDLVTLLNHRLREFQLSRDYAKMSGNLERVNAADEEIISLEDTLFQLNLLVDHSKSSDVTEGILAEALTNGSTSVLGEYDISRYATDPMHERRVMDILSKMGVMDTVEKIDNYIKGKYSSSPVTGEMVTNASQSYDVDIRLIMAMMEQDSSFGTAGLAVRTLNPGNVGNDDDGNIRTYGSWQEGVTAVAEWLSRHRGSTIFPQIPDETTVDPVDTSTSTDTTVDIDTDTNTDTGTTTPNTDTGTDTNTDTGTDTNTDTGTTTPNTDTGTDTNTDTGTDTNTDTGTTTPNTDTGTDTNTDTGTTTPNTDTGTTTPNTDTDTGTDTNTDTGTTTPNTDTGTDTNTDTGTTTPNTDTGTDTAPDTTTTDTDTTTETPAPDTTTTDTDTTTETPAPDSTTTDTATDTTTITN